MVRREVFQVSILLCFFLVFWAVNSSRGAEQPTLPKEAQEVLQGFQQALTDANWAKAMSYCSAEVKKKAAQTESLEAFLKDVVPLAEVISIDVNRMSGWGGGAREDKIIRAHFEARVVDTNWRYPLGWQLSVVKQKGEWFVDFGTKPLDIWRKHEILKSKWINDGFTREEMQAMIEKSNRDLELRLVPLSDKFVIGKPMPFRVEMRNVSVETLGFTAIGGNAYMVNDPMLTKGPNGTELPYMDTSYQTLAGGMEYIEPNTTSELIENYDVRSQYHIVKPGRYSFQLRPRWGLTQPSNVVEVDVLPGQLSAIEDVVEKLTPILPQGWKLTRGQGSLDPGDADSTQIMLIALINPAARKVKNPGIACLVSIILGADGNAIKEFKHVGEYAGRCEWGPVHINVRDD